MIGLLGGTFDPVHVGHLRAALEAREALGLEAVRLIPNARPPHRGLPAAPAPARLAMVRLACAGEPGLAADGRELARAGPSYTVDTLISLRRELGARRPLCLLLGADAARGLASWHRWRELFALAHLVVLRRPGQAAWEGAAGAELAARRADGAAALAAAPAGRVLELEIPLLEVSASDIRRRIAAGRSVRFLVPDPVLDYIRRHGLYAGPAAKEP
ncbi:nicotinate-nucleotide adenylyltransferase [Inmirania thermothiophila]|uniref:Probable nicotinate-nucleotide adenylyltransferase n=1 Tax=Inmirania thermothiophila TaxID=1750597 RepID=A0A3N1Y7Q5_9GAMM|nr:nicotinate-nucleotide adenylyltransferase [Inmirania thermothiophila]ROR34866.1 nicotinate-nucleotide adenylyltransferase [Inmirania thermothiophila]